MPRGPLEVPFDKYPKPGTFRHGLGIATIGWSSKVWLLGLQGLVWWTEFGYYRRNGPLPMKVAAIILRPIFMAANNWSYPVSRWIAHFGEHVFGYCYTNRPKRETA